MTSMGVYRNSENEYVCEYCNIPPFLVLQEALNHVEQVHRVNEPVKVDNIKPEVVPVPIQLPSEINEYYGDLDKGGTMQAAERLMMSLIEDYTISRNNDLREHNKIGPMTLNLGRNAAEAMNNYNKLKVVNKSVNLNIDSGKKSDLDALREMLKKDGATDNNE